MLINKRNVDLLGLLTIKKTTKNRYRESKKEVVALQNELSIIQKRIDSIEDKYLDGKLTKKQYNRMLERYTKEASTIQQQVEMRENPNRGIKIKLISSMFLQKIEFDGKTYRTNSYNKVLDLIGSVRKPCGYVMLISESELSLCSN